MPIVTPAATKRMAIIVPRIIPILAFLVSFCLTQIRSFATMFLGHAATHVCWYAAVPSGHSSRHWFSYLLSFSLHFATHSPLRFQRFAASSEP